jgi:hypothetical protein
MVPHLRVPELTRLLPYAIDYRAEGAAAPRPAGCSGLRGDRLEGAVTNELFFAVQRALTGSEDAPPARRAADLSR